MSNISCVRDVKGKYYVTHGLTSHEFYPIWRSMMSRCYNSNNKSYPDYGARGISVCDGWNKEPESFIDWLISNDYRKGLEVDRINNNLGYSPENCRVTTSAQNARNRRNSVYVDFDGVRTLLIELSEKTGIAYNTLYSRIFVQNLSAEEALSKPIRKRG